MGVWGVFTIFEEYLGGGENEGAYFVAFFGVNVVALSVFLAVQQGSVSDRGHSSEVSRKRKLTRRDCDPSASRQRHTGRNVVMAHSTVAIREGPRLDLPVFSPAGMSEQY